MEKKLEELDEKTFVGLINYLSLFVRYVNGGVNDNFVDNLVNKIKGYLNCMENLKIINFDEQLELMSLLTEYQILKIEEK